MADGLIVETNWLLDLTLERDHGPRVIWDLARSGRLDLFVPALCLAECAKAFESMRRNWRQQSSELRNLRSDLGRSQLFRTELQALVAVDKVSGKVEALLWDVLRQVSVSMVLLQMGRDTMRLAGDLRDLLNLDPADAAVLAFVEESKSAGVCRRFVSRDRVFTSDIVQTYMASVGIEYFADPCASSAVTIRTHCGRRGRRLPARLLPCAPSPPGRRAILAIPFRSYPRDNTRYGEVSRPSGVAREESRQ